MKHQIPTAPQISDILRKTLQVKSEEIKERLTSEFVGRYTEELRELAVRLALQVSFQVDADPRSMRTTMNIVFHDLTDKETP